MTNAPDFYLDFNVNGAERKRLVKAIAEFMQCDAEYLRVPTFAYTVGCFTISADGVVSFDGHANIEKVEELINFLTEQGFVVVRSNVELSKAETFPIILELPNDAVSMDNLMRLLEAKGGLIKKALGLDDLPIEQRKDTVAFPWFPDTLDSDEVQTRIHFISAICEMSKRQKHISATASDGGSEKYAFRCLLLRLGFIGEQYKTERKILLKNLTGSSAYR